MADIDVVVENLAELLTNTVDMATVFYDIFLNPEPMDVNIQMFNKENEFITVTIPNRAKDRITPYVGEGSPEGVVAAPIGSVYVDTASSTVYYKISGSGVDGWNPVLSQGAMEEFLISYLEDRGYITNASLVNYLVSNEYVTIPSLSTYLNVNGYIRSADLTPIETSPLVNKLIIITNDTTEPIKSMVLGDFIANEISTDANNALTRGSDSKLFISNNIANKDLSNLSTAGNAHFANLSLSNLSTEGQAILNNKANIDLSNLSTTGQAILDNKLGQSVPHVIESYQNGTSWYRVYSDGWCEQGGEIIIPGQTGAQITFLKQFANTDYMIMLTSADYQVDATPGVTAGSQSQSGFWADYPSGENEGNVYWTTKGFIS